MFFPQKESWEWALFDQQIFRKSHSSFSVKWIIYLWSLKKSLLGNWPIALSLIYNWLSRKFTLEPENHLLPLERQEEERKEVHPIETRTLAVCIRQSYCEYIGEFSQYWRLAFEYGKAAWILKEKHLTCKCLGPWNSVMSFPLPAFVMFWKWPKL